MNELTLLFYIASDNALAPLVVSEIKAIKDAGFQKDTTVLVYFDPLEKGAATQLLDINSKRKKTKAAKGVQTSIGDGEDPFVRNMSEDEVDSDLTDEMQKVLADSATTAVDSLKAFINFALEKRKANNYMLFTIGHGMIVGNDSFLPDDNPVSSITLAELKKLCELFTQDNQTSLKLLGLHSCSMSSIEVAYQLKGKADYMLATQGTMFVNGWPYRQLLKKTLKHVDSATTTDNGVLDVDYDTLIGKLYFLCLFNFTDFMTAGYSCDLSLIDLRKLDALKEPLQQLIAALLKSLTAKVSPVKNLVLLAHWEAQSFWSENYTDLWDFCDCLQRHCDKANKPAIDELTTIVRLCMLVKDCLAPGIAPRNGSSRAPSSGVEGIVRHTDNCGSEFQYARGLSIYFPWSEPLNDRLATPKPNQSKTRSKTVLENYSTYDFTTEFEPASWLSFLKAYFKGTMRDPRNKRGSVFGDFHERHPNVDLTAANDTYDRVAKAFDEALLKRTPELKKTPDVGGDCTCPSVKNYPIRFSITAGALKAFTPIGDEEERDDE